MFTIPALTTNTNGLICGYVTSIRCYCSWFELIMHSNAKRWVGVDHKSITADLNLDFGSDRFDGFTIGQCTDINEIYVWFYDPIKRYVFARKLIWTSRSMREWVNYWTLIRNVNNNRTRFQLKLLTRLPLTKYSMLFACTISVFFGVYVCWIPHVNAECQSKIWSAILRLF